MSANPAIVEAAEDAGLHYVSDSIPGISRYKKGSGFAYRQPDGSPLRTAVQLDRIRHLAIPPAYAKVWICPDPNGHLQATGRDARGRKQYRYHSRFREARDENKFNKMLAFGKAIPKIRERVDSDLSLRGLPKAKILAVLITLLDKSLIRVGNEEYAKQNKSFGLTTMLNRHVTVDGSKIEFKFLGKSKVKHRIEVTDKRLARVIKKIQDLPGQELFQYVGDDGEPVSVSSADVNNYLGEITGEHFTAKDFRTWWGSILALIELGIVEAPGTKTAQRKAITAVMSTVSKQLGNTPSICRKCYVHPFVVKAFENGALQTSSFESVDEAVAAAESALIRLLEDQNPPTGSAPVGR